MNDISYDMTPAEIKALRLSLNLSQEQFAQRLGVSYPSVNRWEHGRSRPLPYMRLRLQELKQDPHSLVSTKRKPQFGVLQGKMKLPEDRYLLNEPAEVRAELYGEEYR